MAANWTAWIRESNTEMKKGMTESRKQYWINVGTHRVKQATRGSIASKETRAQLKKVKSYKLKM